MIDGIGAAEIATAAYVASVFLIGGLVKGVVGFGTPLIAVPFIGLVYDIPTAVGWTLIPIIISNLSQGYECRDGCRVLRRVWPLLACLGVSLLFSVQLLEQANADILLMLVGLLILMFVGSQLAPRPPKISGRWQTPLLILGGSASGFIGGLTSFYGFPALQVLVALDLKRREFILAASGLFLIGTGILGLGMLMLGIVSTRDLWFSLAMALPTQLGVSIGGRLRDSLSVVMFQRILLAVLTITGLSMVLRPFF